MNIVGFFIFIGMSFTLVAQPLPEKLLQEALDNRKREKITQYDSALIALYSATKPAQRRELLKFIEHQISTSNNLHAVAKGLAWKGILLYRPPFNNPLAAAEAMDMAINKAVESGDDYLMVQVFEKCAYSFMSGGDIQKALFYFLKSTALRNKLGDQYFKEKDMKILGTVADVFYQIQDFRQTILYITQMLKIPYQGTNPHMTSMNTLGLAYQRLNQFDSAMYWYKESLQFAKQENATVWEGIINGNMGATYFDQQKDLEALPLIWKDYHTTIASEKNSAGNTLHRLALLYLRQGKKDSALLLARKSLQIVSSVNKINPWYLRNAYKAMMEVFRKNATDDSAYFYSDRYHHINDSLIGWVANNRASQVQLRLEFEKKSNLINVLLQEKSTEKLRRNLLMASILFLLVAAWMYLRWQKQRHLNQQQEWLHQKEKADADVQNARSQLEAFTQNIIAKNELIEHLQLQLVQQNQQVNDELMSHTILTEHDWLHFKEMFDKANPGFLPGLHQRAPDITAAELRLATLLKLNLGNKHIASMLGIGADAVRKTRSRLRQRLGISVEQDLDDYVRSLALIETA